MENYNKPEWALHCKWVLGMLDGKRADMTGADLKGANMRQAPLTRAIMAHADMEDANLSAANARYAVFSYAKLRGATLVGADLTDADLTGADLTDADLTASWLVGADLTGADLTGAELCGCIGNGREVQSDRVGGIHMTWITDPVHGPILQIGRARRGLEDWREFDGDTVNRMHVGAATPWWSKFRYAVLTMVEGKPAVPHGRR